MRDYSAVSAVTRFLSCFASDILLTLTKCLISQCMQLNAFLHKDVENKGNLNHFECGMVVVSTQAGLSI